VTVSIDPETRYPRFTDEEMDRRRRALLRMMEEAGCEHLILYGANRFGSAVGWATGWPVTREGLVLLSPVERDVLLVQFHNHVPNAREIAHRTDVRWGGTSTTRTASQLLEARGARGRRIGIVGPLGFQEHAVLATAFDVADLGPAYTGLRLVKSAEEIEWVRRGAELSDRAIEALRSGVHPGLFEHHLADLVERAYVPSGATTLIHYFGVTSMATPDGSVPAQYTSGRRIEPGDVLTVELSASFWDYPGQVLRTFTVGADPTPLYRELHDVATAAFDAIAGVLRAGAHAEEVVEAASVIEDAGFTTYDDLLHGFVGGYFPPVLGSRSRTLWEVPDFRFQAGMTVVVQPNVVTPDHRAGVQTGELVLVTEAGIERLHHARPGLHRLR
jgi:Xaa-Pro aminopeptidase